MASTDCGWCGRLVHLKAMTPVRQFPADFSRAVFQAAYACPNCHNLTIATEHPDGHTSSLTENYADAAEHQWGRSVNWLPKRGTVKDFPDVPEHIGQAASEAAFCFSVGAYRAVGSLARAVVEATAKDKSAKGPNLAARIDRLAEGGHIREHTKEQAHEIRHFGNDMAHGDFAAPISKEEAEEIMELLTEVLSEVYQSPARLARVKEARRAKTAEQSGDA